MNVLLIDNSRRRSGQQMKYKVPRRLSHFHGPEAGRVNANELRAHLGYQHRHFHYLAQSWEMQLRDAAINTANTLIFIRTFVQPKTWAHLGGWGSGGDAAG